MSCLFPLSAKILFSFSKALLTISSLTKAIVELLCFSFFFWNKQLWRRCNIVDFVDKLYNNLCEAVSLFYYRFSGTNEYIAVFLMSSFPPLVSPLFPCLLLRPRLLALTQWSAHSLQLTLSQSCDPNLLLGSFLVSFSNGSVDQLHYESHCHYNFQHHKSCRSKPHRLLGSILQSL